MEQDASIADRSRPASPMLQQATPGNVRSLLLDGSTPVLLLGAGASITSGIPAAAATAEKVARWAWCREQGRSPDDIRVTRSDYWPWLREQNWFRDDLDLADQYPQIVENLLGVRKQRRDFFERLIAPGAPPKEGYRSLARILNEGWITTILTTNFDHCLDDARVLENKPHLLVSIKTADDLIRFNTAPAEPQLLYLHGSVEHYSDKNLDSEVDALEPGIVERVAPLLRDHPLLVVGYRGTERSIMQGLFLEQMATTNRFAQGIYWCVRESEMGSPLSPLVMEVAKQAGTNFQLVPIKGFDEFLQQDLWDRLRADGAVPIRRDRGFRPVDTPPDMRPLDGAAMMELEQPTLFSRLSQYAKRLGISAPENFNADWLEQESYLRNLIVSVNESPTPTLAGWLLFARVPQNLVINAVVRFRASGPRRWIIKCFGEDVVTGTEEGGDITIEQDVSGNLWSQLNGLTDLLALINSGFRLKEEISRTAYPYDSLALKEIVVNALVHRDYTRTEPITVDVRPDRISVASPGGLMSDVATQIGAATIETVIRSGARGIKGYRNPVITDLFYGGGQMDRSGSGLSDIWSLTANNNGDVHFGPDANNQNFVVCLMARPEAVDEITNTAVPLVTQTVRYAANVLNFEALPDRIWHAGTSASSGWALKKESGGLAVPPGFVSDGRFFTFYDLEKISDRYQAPFDTGDIETVTLDELLALPNGENIFLKLMHEAVFEHLRSIGLKVDHRRRRAHFPKTETGERRITYRGRIKRATRTVVKARTRRDSADVIYYEHKAMSFSVMAFGSAWGMIITPGYAFTRDGEGKPIGRDKINVLSTRRAARDFNPSVHHDVTFWAAILSAETDGLFAIAFEQQNEFAEYGPTILLSATLPTIAFSTISSDVPSGDDNEDAEMQALDEEITALAIEEEAEALQENSVEGDEVQEGTGSDN